MVALRVQTYIIPKPSSVLALLFSSQIHWEFHALTTLEEALPGFFLAAVVGISIAVLFSFSRAFRLVAEPLVVAAQLMPKIAFVPIFFLWFGLNDFPKVLTVFFICVFPIIVDTAAGLSSARADMIDLVMTYTSSRTLLLGKVLFPNALPQIFSGLKIGITLAMTGAVVAEFVSSSSGLGFLILSAQARLDTTLGFAAAALLVAIGFVLYGAIVLAERLLVPWRKIRT